MLTTRLTALWALSESGLGGFMHALKIPFTGFFLGGFAVVIITLIAHHAPDKFRSVMQATLLVVLVKATVSPHSPPMAYIAVLFQGLSGALVLQLPVKRLPAVLFGMLALFESAVQKFLVMTIIFGKSVWEALDLFFKGVLKDLSLNPEFSFSFWLITIYTVGYTLWGMLLGWWASGLPQTLLTDTDRILTQYNKLTTGAESLAANPKKGRNKKLAGVFFILLFVASVFLFKGDGAKAWFAVLRTIAALLTLFFVINPLVRWGMQRWIEKRREKQALPLSSVIDMLPELRNYISPAITLARQRHKGIMVYKAFVVNLIILSLYNETPHAEE